MFDLLSPVELQKDEEKWVTRISRSSSTDRSVRSHDCVFKTPAHGASTDTLLNMEGGHGTFQRREQVNPPRR